MGKRVERGRGQENSMVFFTSCSSHFPRAVGRISATFSLIKKFTRSNASAPLSLSLLSLSSLPIRSPPSRLYRARRVQTGFSLLKSITAGRRDERVERDGAGGVAERGSKWGDYFGRTEVAELISKNPGRSNRQDLEGFPDELGDDGGHPHLLYFISLCD